MKKLKYILLIISLKNYSSSNIQINFLKIIGSVSKFKEQFYHSGRIGKVTSLKPDNPIKIETQSGTQTETWENGKYVAFIRDGHVVKIRSSKLLN